jgi:hypothetical protein
VTTQDETPPAMTEDERREYAELLIKDHAKDVEYLSVHEMAWRLPGGEISDEDATAVHDLIGKAVVTVTWPEEATDAQH